MIRREWIIRRKGLIVWILVIFMMLLGGMTKLDALTGENAQSLQTLMQSLPKILLVVYGLDGIDLSKVEGYFGLLLMYTLLVLAFQGSTLGASLLAGEAKEKTDEFLFTRPLYRLSLAIRKFSAGLSIVIFLDIITLVVSFYILSQLSRTDLFAKTVTAVLLTHFSFYFIGYGLSLAFHNQKIATRAAIFLPLGGYLMLVFSGLFEKPWLADLTPLGSLGSAYLNEGNALAGLLFFWLSLVLLGLGAVRFRERDLL